MAEEGTSYFLDTSALVKLYHHELGSEIVEAWVANQAVQIWLSELARVELHSVFVRKVREGELTEAILQAVLECFREDLHSRFQVVPLTDDIVERAISLLLSQAKNYPLRTLDALHIASAQAVEKSGLAFVAADKKLFTATSGLFSRIIDPEAKVGLGP